MGDIKQELVRTKPCCFIWFLADHPFFYLLHFLCCLKQGLTQQFAKYTVFPKSCLSHIPADGGMCYHEHPGPTPV